MKACFDQKAQRTVLNVNKNRTSDTKTMVKGIEVNTGGKR